jgi:acyl-CoA thioesterase FadM
VKLGNKSLEMTQKITDLQDNIKSVNTSILVGFDYVNQSSMEIPEEWKNMIADFEKDVIRK